MSLSRQSLKAIPLFMLYRHWVLLNLIFGLFLFLNMASRAFPSFLWPARGSPIFPLSSLLAASAVVFLLHRRLYKRKSELTEIPDIFLFRLWRMPMLLSFIGFVSLLFPSFSIASKIYVLSAGSLLILFIFIHRYASLRRLRDMVVSSGKIKD